MGIAQRVFKALKKGAKTGDKGCKPFVEKCIYLDMCSQFTQFMANHGLYLQPNMVADSLAPDVSTAFKYIINQDNKFFKKFKKGFKTIIEDKDMQFPSVMKENLALKHFRSKDERGESLCHYFLLHYYQMIVHRFLKTIATKPIYPNGMYCSSTSSNKIHKLDNVKMIIKGEANEHKVSNLKDLSMNSYTGNDLITLPQLGAALFKVSDDQIKQNVTYNLLLRKVKSWKDAHKNETLMSVNDSVKEVDEKEESKSKKRNRTSSSQETEEVDNDDEDEEEEESDVFQIPAEDCFKLGVAINTVEEQLSSDSVAQLKMTFLKIASSIMEASFSDLDGFLATNPSPPENSITAEAAEENFHEDIHQPTITRSAIMEKLNYLLDNFETSLFATETDPNEEDIARLLNLRGLHGKTPASSKHQDSFVCLKFTYIPNDVFNELHALNKKESKPFVKEIAAIFNECKNGGWVSSLDDKNERPTENLVVLVTQDLLHDLNQLESGDRQYSSSEDDETSGNSDLVKIFIFRKICPHQ